MRDSVSSIPYGFDCRVVTPRQDSAARLHEVPKSSPPTDECPLVVELPERVFQDREGEDQEKAFRHPARGHHSAAERGLNTRLKQPDCAPRVADTGQRFGVLDQPRATMTRHATTVRRLAAIRPGGTPDALAGA